MFVKNFTCFILFVSSFQFIICQRFIEYDENGEYICNHSQWPDDLNSVDGFLELKCHQLNIKCDKPKSLPTCDSTWRSRCPPLHYVSGIRAYFVGRRKRLHYKVRCCTHSILKSEHYKGEYSRSFDAGEVFNAVGQNKGGEVINYLANVYSTSTRDHQRIKIGKIQCDRTTTTTTTTTTRRPRRTKRPENRNKPRDKNTPDNNNGRTKNKPPETGPDSKKPTGTDSASVGGAGGQPSCFSPDGLVQTKNGIKRMDEITIGEQVLSSLWDGTTASYQTVVHFLHRDPSVRTQFLTIITSEGHNLTLSPNHLLPLFRCDKIPKSLTKNSASVAQWLADMSFVAARAKPGLCVLNHDSDGKVRSVSIEKVLSNEIIGIYAPVTTSGTIVVNGIQASCYCNIENQFLQHAFFSAAYKMATGINYILEWFRSVMYGCASSELSGDVPLIVKMLLFLSETALGY